MFVLGSPVAAMAAGEFKVRDIQVIGLERIAIGTVFNYLPIKVGQTVGDEDVSNAIRSLFKTGFFRDVKISQRGNVLVVTVSERPSIAEVEVTGGNKIKKEDLEKSIKAAGLSVGRTFNRSLFDRIEQDLKQQYFNLGYYSVKIDSRIESAGGNKVKVFIEVAEGKPARIKDINIIGNQNFTNKRLLAMFAQKSTKDKRVFTKKDQYSQQQLRADIEKLRNFYLDNGYLDFSIKSNIVTIGPNKESIFVTLAINEGIQYRIDEIAIKGRLLLDRKKVEELVELTPGEIFSRKKASATVDKITSLYSGLGYANARINAVPETTPVNGKVRLDLIIDPGKIVYVRRIEITGNNITQDRVIRRELRQLEGARYTLTGIQASQRRLQRLGFFDEVHLTTQPVSGTDDLVDIKVTVKERSTGSISLGGGYSDENGLFVNASYQERNAFGTGNDITLMYDNSEATTVYEFSFNNPYYTQSGISRQLEMHSRTNDATKTQTGGYIMQTDGLGINYGIPISDDRKIGIGAGVEKIILTTDSNSAQVAQDFVAANGPENNLLRMNLSWSQDTLNDYRFPTKGTLYKVSAEGGIPGGNLTYVKGSVDGSIYFPFSEKSTLRVRAMVGYASAYADTTEVPFFKNFFAGGASSVRGFRARSLGPRDTGINNDPIGGPKMLNANMEYFFPFPGSKEQESSMRLSLFLDAGMVYAANDQIDPAALRYSAGLAFTWFTPAFPIALSLGYPLNSQTGDELEPFQFSIGIPIR